MKNIERIAILSAALLAMACNKETVVETPQTDTPVHFNMTIGGLPASRTVTGNGTEGIRNVAWRAGDAVGIFVNGEAPARQYVYETDGDGIWKEASKADAIYVRTTDTYSFYSYYPYSSEVVKAASFDAVEAEVLADQSAKSGETSGYDLSDVLLAARTGVTGDELGNVVMQYSHAFAMVEVFVTGSEVTAAPKEVRLKNVKRSATLDLAAKEAALKTDAAAQNVIMCPVESTEETEGWLYRAIVPAQSIAAGDRLLEIELEDKSWYFASPDGGVAYTAGKYRRIEATIGAGKTGLTFPSGSIDAWEPAEGTIPPVSGIEIPVDLVTVKIADLTAGTLVQSGNAATYLQDQTNKSFINETCWTMSTYATGGNPESIAAEVVTEDGFNSVRLLSESGVAFGWYKSGLRYHHVGEFKPGYYRLEITLKKSADCAAKDLSVFIRTDKTAAHAWSSGLFFSLKNKDGNPFPRVSTKPVTTEWAVNTIYFDFNQAFSTANTPGASDSFENVSEDAEAYDYFDLAIMPNGGGKQDFYIRDVNLIKVSKDEYDAQ